MEEQQKRLVKPHISDPQVQVAAEDFLSLFKNSGKITYQVFCPKCSHGPMFTVETGLICQRCSKKLIVVRMPSGDYKVEVLER